MREPAGFFFFTQSHISLQTHGQEHSRNPHHRQTGQGKRLDRHRQQLRNSPGSSRIAGQKPSFFTFLAHYP